MLTKDESWIILIILLIALVMYFGVDVIIQGRMLRNTEVIDNQNTNFIITNLAGCLNVPSGHQDRSYQ